MTKRRQLLIITNLLLISICAASPAFSRPIEQIADYSASSLPVLNDELRKKSEDITDVSNRVDTLEAYYAQDTASTDAYVVALAKAPTAYAAGLHLYFKAVTANTGACTLNVNGLGAKSLKSLHDQDPADSYIEAGSIVEVMYDGTNFQILNPDANP